MTWGNLLAAAVGGFIGGFIINPTIACIRIFARELYEEWDSET